MRENAHLLENILVKSLVLCLLFPGVSHLANAAPKGLVIKNQPAIITGATIPKKLQPGKPFKLTVTAKDDRAVTGITVKYLNKTRTIRARYKGQKQASFTVNLRAPKTGKQRIEIRALDGSRLSARPRILSADVSAAAAAPRVMVRAIPVTQLSNSMSTADLDRYVQSLKSGGKSISQAAGVLKAGNIAGDKAFDTLRRIYNSPVEFVAGIMKSAGYGLSSFVQKFVNSATNQTLGWLFESLRDAGFDLDDITFSLSGVMNIGNQAAALTWKQLGERSEPVMRLLRDRFGIEAGDMIAPMKAAGYSLIDIVRGLKSVFGAKAYDIVVWARENGYSANTISQAIKTTFSSTAGQMGLMLKDAGFTPLAITNAIKSKYSKSASQMIGILFNLGFNLSEVKNAIASSFSMGLAQVAALIASLGF
ncbi:hypothetical protein MNBD_GAMMA15-2541 [hydrothermal vent metagenome]|uniref:Uncharacterized protein n=1 Tax=hydrothermal vent metagenome TaxID=652676 RepID=A0A3B0YVF9_9ZZZZ